MHINDLPHEVLNKIFEFGATISQGAEDDTYSLPVTVSQTCRLWHQLALENPLLNRISFSLDSHSLQRAKRNLDRSTSWLLYIYMVVPGPVHDHTPVATNGLEFLQLVRAESHRWRSINLRIPSYFAHKLEQLWPESTPLLEHLSIHITSFALGEQGLGRVPLPIDANRLQSVNVGHYPIFWDQWTCHSVTELSLGPFDSLNPGPTMYQLSQVLSLQSNRLRTFTLRGRWQALSDDDKFMGPVVLRALTSFSILATISDHVAKVIAGCTFPALSHLEIQVSFNNAPLAPEIKEILCTHPLRFGEVKDLSIGLIGIPRGVLKDVVRQAFPKVNKVTLWPYIVLDDDLASFIAGSWPKMSTLELAEAEVRHVRSLVKERPDNSILKNLRLKVARGSIYKEDYDFIASHVENWSIGRVRSTSGWVYPAFAAKGPLPEFKKSDLINNRPVAEPQVRPLFQRGVMKQL